MVWFQVLCRSLRCLVDQFEVLCRTLRCLVSPLSFFVAPLQCFSPLRRLVGPLQLQSNWNILGFWSICILFDTLHVFVESRAYLFDMFCLHNCWCSDSENHFLLPRKNHCLGKDWDDKSLQEMNSQLQLIRADACHEFLQCFKRIQRDVQHEKRFHTAPKTFAYEVAHWRWPKF